MKWAYGVTTVPQRINDSLPRSIRSLRSAGFESPRLFVDGEAATTDLSNTPPEVRGLVPTFHPKLRAYGNWLLALLELYLGDHKADYYAIFQDDIVASDHLKIYLEKCKYPAKGYWNLITYPENQEHIKTMEPGWYLSNQQGKGAQGLVFNREAVMILLNSQVMIGRVHHPRRGYRNIDGGVVTAMRNAGWKEWIHCPSLLYHTGDVSAIGNKKQPIAASFRGEGFNLLDLLKKEAAHGTGNGGRESPIVDGDNQGTSQEVDRQGLQVQGEAGEAQPARSSDNPVLPRQEGCQGDGGEVDRGAEGSSAG